MADATGALADHRSTSLMPWRHGVRVLTYHGVVERRADERLDRNFHLLSDLRRHARLLRRIGVIPLAEVRDALLANEPLPGRAVITMDDGYRSTLLAADVFAAFGLPFTVFVSTGVVGTPRTIWTGALSLHLLRGPRNDARVLGRRWDLSTRSKRLDAFDLIRRQMKALTAAARREAMEELEAYAGVTTEELVDRNPSFRMLDWAEIRTLADAKVTIGSHGVDHEIQHAAQPADVCRFELTTSRSMLLERGLDCFAFAYPDGASAGGSLVPPASVGYDLAMTTVPGVVTRATSPSSVPRVGPPSRLRSLVRTYIEVGRG